MSEMVERVAAGIYSNDFHGDPDTAFEDLPDDVRDGYLLTARAAIEAMRAPTDAMVTKGWELIRGNLRPDEIYPHMIDEALK